MIFLNLLNILELYFVKQFWFSLFQFYAVKVLLPISNTVWKMEIKYNGR